MPERVIRHGAVVEDRWQFLGVDAPLEEGVGLPAGPIVLPLSFVLARAAGLAARGEPVGAWLAPADDPAQLAPHLPQLALVAVHFPKFTDGRGYSTAALLRTRYGYRGELRAFGDVGRDQLFYLRRCGFDSFALPPHRDPEAALAGFRDFTVPYQGAVDDPRPLFRRRLAAGSTT